jgi:phage terminase large subunit-like protein
MPLKKEPKAKVDIQEVYEKRSASKFLVFMGGLRIDSAYGPKVFSKCIQPFQQECFESLAPSLQALQEGEMPPIRRFWIERTKKSSKDADLAVCLLWLIAFAKRPFLIQVCAANRKQAGIVRSRIKSILAYNHWLDDYVEIQRHMIISKNGLGELIIESTDSTGGAHGETPDLLVLNELVHVAKWETMQTHRSNANGVPQGVVIISTNAGIRGTSAWDWREKAIKAMNKNPDKWRFHIWDKKAPWIPDVNVEEERELDTIGNTFKRLWEGKWVLGTGDAVDEDSINRCFVLEGPLEDREYGWNYIAGLDLGIKKDHSGIAVIGVNVREKKLKIAAIKAVTPTVPIEKENGETEYEVSAAAVENACVRLWKLFLIDWFGYDPAAGGSFMAQRLRDVGVPMREVSFAKPDNLTAMARSFVQVLKDGKLEAYDDEEGRLRRDFGKFTITYKPPSSYKLEAVSDVHGHADVGTAVIIALPEAVERMKSWEGLNPDDVLWDEEDDKPFTANELDELPEEMREIYDGVIPLGGDMIYDDFDDGDDVFW